MTGSNDAKKSALKDSFDLFLINCLTALASESQVILSDS